MRPQRRVREQLYSLGTVYEQVEGRGWEEEVCWRGNDGGLLLLNPVHPRGQHPDICPKNTINSAVGQHNINKAAPWSPHCINFSYILSFSLNKKKNYIWLVSL